jgi:hypothetical protein
MSDIVVCRLWIPVDVKQYYNPVLTFLETNKPENWKGLLIYESQAWCEVS